MLTEAKKAEKVAFAKAHIKADRLIPRKYFNDENRGCSVGCDAIDIAKAKGDLLSHRGIHAYVANYFGTPEWLERLRDTVFEGLPAEDRASWHLSLAEALPVGVDFEPVGHRIQRDILLEVAAKSIGDGDEDWRVSCRASVAAVAALHEKSLTERVSKEDWSAAAEAAWSAAAEAAAAEAAAAEAEWSAESAESAAWSAESAARSAWSAWSAEWSAESAARSAARSAWSAHSAAYQEISEIVLKHLREAGQ